MAASDDLQTKILSSGPSSETLFILLSRMREEGKSGEVIQTCLKALDNYPGDISIRKLLAETFLEAGFISQAEMEMEKISRAIKDLATIYKNKAEILAKQHRSEAAVEAARTYLAHYPDDQDAIRLLQELTPPEEVPEEIEEAPAETTQAASIPDYPEPAEELETPPEPEETTPPATEETGPPIPSPDIATPTLAEVYVTQEQMPEAIQTYERVLEQNPEDHDSRERLQELQGMNAAEAPGPEPGDEGDRVKEKTEKMINTLESWLEEIREIAKSPIS
ncbi:hypothetical protein ACFL4N_00110 [Thermodesulfobacteriota bacterium]